MHFLAVIFGCVVIFFAIVYFTIAAVKGLSIFEKKEKIGEPTEED